MKTSRNKKQQPAGARKISKEVQIAFIFLGALIIACGFVLIEMYPTVALVLVIVGVVWTSILMQMLSSKKDKEEWQRQLVSEKTKQRRELEERFQKENELRMQIVERLNMRQMTGAEAYEIFENLLSQGIEELEKTKRDLLSGEKQMREELYKRICSEKELSQEQKDETRRFLRHLNLSELELAQELILGKEDETYSKKLNDMHEITVHEAQKESVGSDEHGKC